MSSNWPYKLTCIGERSRIDFSSGHPVCTVVADKTQHEHLERLVAGGNLLNSQHVRIVMTQEGVDASMPRNEPWDGARNIVDVGHGKTTAEALRNLADVLEKEGRDYGPEILGIVWS